MDTIIERFDNLKSNILSLNAAKQVNIIAVSKTFSLEHIKPLIDYGHVHFGENKVQEAKAKWTEIKNQKKNLKLHMIGKLQRNKVKDALKIFDYIHSLDNSKLADSLSKSEKDMNKSLKYFIQVNIGNESQKSGIAINEIDGFLNYCTREKKLNVIGLMIIPPNDNNTEKYFRMTNDLNKSFALKELSMGMSADFKEAILNNASFIRIGSLIFGNRT